jgi:hypothetical protein
LAVDECYADKEYEVYAAEYAVRGRYLVSDLGTAPKMPRLTEVHKVPRSGRS